MKENEVEVKLGAYAESLGNFDRPIRTPKLNRLALAMIPVGVATIGLIAVLAWPKKADAAMLQSLDRAITNAKSMDCRMYLQNRAGVWVPFLRVSYAGKSWRTETLHNPENSTTVIQTDGRVYVDVKGQKFANVRPLADSEPILRPPSRAKALEYVKSMLTWSSKKSFTATISPGEMVDHKETYKVRLSNKEMGFLGEIIVDKQTNLPLSAQTWRKDPGQHTRWDYNFNTELPNGLFKLSPGRAVIDLSKSYSARQAMWKRPIAKFRSLDILDASVAPDGTIWIATHQTDPSGLDPHVDQLKANSGSPFSPAIEVVTSLTNHPRIRIYGFVPILRGSKVESACSVSFKALRVDERHPEAGLAAIGPKFGAIGSVEVPLRREKGTPPNYFNDLGLEMQMKTLPAQLAEARAQGLEGINHYAEAGEIHYQLAKQVEEMFPSYIFMRREALRCFQKAGNQAMAERIQKEIANVDQTRQTHRP